MTNAMPSLQMTIKLSYGWRPLRPPAKLGFVTGQTGGDIPAGHAEPRPYDEDGHRCIIRGRPQGSPLRSAA